MPLSDDTEILETSNGLVETLRAAAGGADKSFRPAHARGHLLTGSFTPSPSAATLSKAHHFNHPTPITLRFSSSTGLPTIPDTSPDANPRGFALRFNLPDLANRRQHTDIIAHSTPYFPVRTGAALLELFTSLASLDADTAVPAFLAAHPETQRFLAAPKPSPASFATEKYYGVNAFVLTGAQGGKTTVRYRVEPVAGHEVLTAAETAERSESYLFDELPGRLERGPIEFRLLAQVADEGDVVDDATVLWPEERRVVELGVVRVEGVMDEEESLREQKKIIFDPIPRVEGVDVSGDPLLDVRASAYLISGRQRRAA